MSSIFHRPGIRVAGVLAALSAGALPAQALEYNFGGVQVFLDTTISAGVSMRVAERNTMFLPEGNGGPAEIENDILPIPLVVAGPIGALANPAAQITLDTQNGTFSCPAAAANNCGDNYDGSINTDDGRLNFDQGDLTSGIVKMTNDIQANWENYTFFARVSSFYDAVLDDSGSYERSGIQDGAEVDAARDIDLLDFYVSGDFNVGDLPLNVRLGKQVVNWGEATFILNGISSWNPLDVNAFRRPGAEIKEGLLPVWGAYASLGLPYDLSLEAFYQLEWQEFQLDRPGTPFAGSDVARVGSGFGGNIGAASFIGGGGGGLFTERNCSVPSGLTGALDAAYLAAGRTTLVCGAGGTNAFVDFLVDYPIGQTEQFRLATSDGVPDIARLEDREPSDSGQYGAALRWYAEDLNSTEFGFYFMNYHSRLPIASQRAYTSGALTTFQSIVVSGDNGSANGRAPLPAGCAAAGGGGLLALAGGAGGDPAITANAVSKLNYMNNVIVNDDFGSLAAMEGVLGVSGTTLASGGLNAALAGGAVNESSLLEGFLINCAVALGQSNLTTLPGFPATPIMTDGTEVLAVRGTTANPAGLFRTGLFFEYPEDIKLFGASFNTTIGDWGVQGEVAYRHDQPLQLDTDQITLAALGNSCLLDLLLGVDAFTAGLPGLADDPLDQSQTFGPTALCGSTPAGVTEFSGVKREEVVTFDIGTTATYTNSNPLVGLLGADIGILLTEVGAMWVPDVPDEGDFSVAQLQNVCTAGTDLPLGGFVALDPRAGCRANQFSYGYVLVGQLQYNNAFGTPITLTPQIAWSHDVKGNSPAPLSNYREGSKSVSLAVNGTYQNTWRGGISYVNNFGNEKYSRDGDQDFVSINLSYSF